MRSTGNITYVGPLFWKDFENYDLLKSIKKMHCPVLFIHGEKDNKIPVQDMEMCFDAANQPKEKLIVQGASHGLTPKREEVAGIISHWFKNNLPD